MPLKSLGAIKIPDAAGSAFDHAAFDPNTRRVFIAHTAHNTVEVIDHDAVPGVADADDGEILVTNRGSTSLDVTLPRYPAADRNTLARELSKVTATI